MNGVIDDNEMRTLVAIVYSKSPTQKDIDALYEVCSNFSLGDLHTSKSTHVDIQVNKNSKINHMTTITTNRYPSIEMVHNCSNVTNALMKNVNWAHYMPSHQTLTDSEVAFEMIGMYEFV